MIVSWNWLTDYLRLAMPVETLTEKLALTGLNHESTEDVGGDLAIDLEVTSNRPDCLGHLGIAREIGVLFDQPFCIPDPRPPVSGPSVETLTSVEVEEPGLCPRFTARVISGAAVGESPWWLRKRLETIGVRPISNLVDVTNYVMFECGQPLHAYDLDKLIGRKLIVRKARKGETLAAINGKTYELRPDMLVIADAERPVGLAGVMGGLDTEIGPTTKNVLIEAAQFDPMTVRRTSRQLGLFSPSSFRFERPLDPEITDWASRRCAELSLKVAGGTLHPGVIDVGGKAAKRSEVTLRFAQIERILGIPVPRDKAARILESLGLEKTAETEEAVTVRPPSWRHDLDREIDLIEEVARIHGYEHIPEDRAVPLTSAPRGLRERVEGELRGTLTGVGISEAVTFSLVEESLGSPVGEPLTSPPLRIDHSSRKKEVALRQSLVPSLLAVRRHNEAHGNANAELFEIANVYLPRPGQELPDEPTRLAILAGREFRVLKGIVETLLARLHTAPPLTAKPLDDPLFTRGRAAELFLGDDRLGCLGEISRQRLDELDLKSACSAAELDLGLLMKHARLVAQYQPLPQYPSVSRDLSLVAPHSLTWAELAAVVTEAAGPNLAGLEYLDTFRGGNLADGEQSIHFGMTFRNPEKTLTGDEVERSVKRVVDACDSRLHAKLRA